jgi:hypothetical protein
VSTTPAAKLPPVLTTPVANLPPVSTTRAANFATSFTSVAEEIFCFWFFHESVSPSPIVFHLDRFEFFQKFAEIFASQGEPPVSATPVANFSTIFGSVVDTSGKFAAGGKLPPVSTTPAANLEP